jgi:hypothetical protein
MLWIRTLFWRILVYRTPNISGVISNYFWVGTVTKIPQKISCGVYSAARPYPTPCTQHPKLALSLNSELNILHARAVGP